MFVPARVHTGREAVPQEPAAAASAVKAEGTRRELTQCLPISILPDLDCFRTSKQILKANKRTPSPSSSPQYEPQIQKQTRLSLMSIAEFHHNVNNNKESRHREEKETWKTELLRVL